MKLKKTSIIFGNIAERPQFLGGYQALKQTNEALIVLKLYISVCVCYEIQLVVFQKDHFQ